MRTRIEKMRWREKEEKEELTVAGPPRERESRALFTFYSLAQIHWTPTSFPEALHLTLEL